MPLHEQPRVSVIIATRNRLEDLLLTLEHVRRDTCPGVEVLVYDDASDIDPRPAVARRFPEVCVVRNDRRAGHVELRNRLVAMARSPVCVSLDDDSSFESADALTRIVAVFAAHPRLGLLSCRIRQGAGDVWPARNGGPLRATASFIGCGFAVRSSAFAAVGGFDTAILRQGEERDLAVRLLDAGYEIRQADDILVHHRESPVGRDHQFIHAHALRNELLFVLKRAPAPFVPGRLARHALGHMAYCAARGWWRAWGCGMAGFLRRAPRALGQRRSVSRRTWREYTDLMRTQRILERQAKAGQAGW